MWLREIEADRLRNLKAVSLTLPAGVTALVGRNAQGKSSLLEAIYLLATGRSFRTRRNEELISWDGGPLRVSGVVDHRLGPTRLTVVMDGEARSLLVDGAEQELVGFLGRLDVVDLTMERMNVLRGGPEERRRFLDRGLVGLDPTYLQIVGLYRRVLQQRNALLRTWPRYGGGGPEAELAVWTERLVGAASELHQRRREYTHRISALLGDAAAALFPDGRELTLGYRPSPAATGREDPTRFAGLYEEALARDASKERTLGHTALGPHRDDLTVELDGIDLRKFGSAGQLRASMIALKLGKLSLFHQERGEAPLFLMDDFDTDLDEKRAAALAAFLTERGSQVVLATSKEEMVERLGVSCTRIRIDDGVALVP